MFRNRFRRFGFVRVERAERGGKVDSERREVELERAELPFEEVRVPARFFVQSVVEEPVRPDFLFREAVRAHARDRVESEPFRRLVTRVPADDNAVGADHQRLLEPEAAYRLRDARYRPFVPARIAGVGGQVRRFYFNYFHISSTFLY